MANWLAPVEQTRDDARVIEMTPATLETPRGRAQVVENTQAREL
jgi:hypothetical protein